MNRRIVLVLGTSFDMIKQMRFCLHSTHSKHRMKLFSKQLELVRIYGFEFLSELSVDCINLKFMLDLKNNTRELKYSSMKIGFPK